MRVACKNKKGHIAPSLSCLDILTVLYYFPEFRKDKIYLSKGHGWYGLYAIQADLGLIKKEDFENFTASGCLEGFGSLGHGLPIAVGYAFGNYIQNKEQHTFCIVGDGEMQEGSMWEALNFMQHYDLRNLTIIIDHNRLQAMDKIDNVLSHNLLDRCKAWGLQTWECDGHDHWDLIDKLECKPQVLIAHTIKGKGYKYMENIPKFHFRVPDDNQR